LHGGSPAEAPKAFRRFNRGCRTSTPGSKLWRRKRAPSKSKRLNEKHKSEKNRISGD
jgi:hypothetical protein